MASAPVVPAASADRRGVLDSSFIPKLVQSSSDLQLGAGAYIALIGLAIIADSLDDPREPVLCQAQLFTEIAVGAESTLQLRLVRLGHLFEVLLGHAHFLGVDHRKQRPFDDVE